MAIPITPNIEAYQITVIVSMLIVIMLKIIGMYYATKAKYPEIVFNYGYIVTGIMGVFAGYGSYLTFVPYDDTLVTTFMGAGIFALSMNILIDFGGKATAPAEVPPPKTT